MNVIQEHKRFKLPKDGGITPYISGDTESDLFQYYIGYSDSSGVLTHVPISIADIDDNDNFHQLCFSTSDEIVKISMMANTVKDPNHDPNLYSEIYVSYSYSLSTSSSPSNSGTVSGDGTYNSGSTISISATPSNGYQFSHWSGDLPVQVIRFRLPSIKIQASSQTSL